MWLLGLLSLHSSAAVRLAVRTSLDGDVGFSDLLGNGSNASLVADDEQLGAASGDAAIGNANASASDATVRNQTTMNLSAVSANVSENGTMDSQSSTAGKATWLDAGMNFAGVSAAQLSDKMRAAANLPHAAVPLAAAQMRRNATAALDIKGGRCGARDKGSYLGCNLGCVCGWGNTCYKSILVVHGGSVDVGVCEASMSVMIGVSLLIMLTCVATIIGSRLLLLGHPLDAGAPASPLKSSLAKARATSSASPALRPGDIPSSSELGSDSGSDYECYDVNDGPSSGASLSESQARAAPRRKTSLRSVRFKSEVSAKSASTAASTQGMPKSPQSTCPKDPHKLSWESCESAKISGESGD